MVEVEKTEKVSLQPHTHKKKVEVNEKEKNNQMPPNKLDLFHLKVLIDR